MGTMTAAPPPDGIEVHEDVPLARHTYLRLGGPARFLAIPKDIARGALPRSRSGIPLQGAWVYSMRW